MADTNQPSKETTFNFRLDSALKAAFAAAAEADHRPAAEVLRYLMRSYVEQKRRSIFEAEALRRSLAIATRARDPQSDEHEAMREPDAEPDHDAPSAG